MLKIQINDLSHIYDLKGVKTHAIQNIDFEIASNSFVAIMGKSGMGKSTLLQSIAGLIKFSSGSILVDDFELAGATDEELSNYRLKIVGMMFQDFNLADFLTVEENVQLPMLLADENLSKRKIRSEELLKEFGIVQYKNRYPDQLSGGEKQRVALCVALSNDPPIILADEPTGNLDTENSIHIYNYLQKIHQVEKKTILMVTHDTNSKDYVEKTYQLKRDKIIED